METIISDLMEREADEREIQTKVQTAISLLEFGDNAEKISKVTRLPLAQVEAIAKQMAQ